MVRMRAPPRYAVGTRVAIPVEGRTGHVAGFDMDSGLYTLQFSDGHEQTVDAEGVERVVIRTTPTASINDSQRAAAATSAGENPMALIGTMLVKVAKSYEGKEIIMEGSVADYYPTANKFRVLFQDGQYADMTRDEVDRAIVARDTREKSRGGEKSKKRHRGENGDGGKKKKNKAQGGASVDSAIAIDDDGEDNALELKVQKYDSRAMAYTMVRRILITILEQNGIQALRTDKQMSILRNNDMKPKRALEGFVGAGGLRPLQKVLQMWMRNPSMHSGVLLALKILAILPVTLEQLTHTSIAQTLRSIQRISETSELVDQTLGDLAKWIIRNWSKTVVKRPVAPSPKDLLAQQAGSIHRAGNAGGVHVIASLAGSGKSPGGGNIAVMRPKPTSRQEETARMQALLNGDDNENMAANGGAASEKVVDEVVIYLPQFNSLGSEDARRPTRKTQLLETLASRINQEFADGVVVRDHDEQTEQEEKVDDSQVTPGRIKVGKPQIWEFDKEIPVAELLDTTRSKALGQPKESRGATKTLPNKLQAPIKSILKSKDLSVPDFLEWR